MPRNRFGILPAIIQPFPVGQMKSQDITRILHTQTPLITARLALRPLRLEDASDIFLCAHDPEVTRYTTWDASHGGGQPHVH